MTLALWHKEREPFGRSAATPNGPNNSSRRNSGFCILGSFQKRVRENFFSLSASPILRVLLALASVNCSPALLSLSLSAKPISNAPPVLIFTIDCLLDCKRHNFSRGHTISATHVCLFCFSLYFQSFVQCGVRGLQALQ